jgi:hypothetical protein
MTVNGCSQSEARYPARYASIAQIDNRPGYLTDRLLLEQTTVKVLGRKVKRCLTRS